MAESNSTHSLPIDSLNKATLKIAGASAIISAFGIFIEDTCGENGEMPVTGSLIRPHWTAFGVCSKAPQLTF